MTDPDQVFRELSAELPAVTLFLGPSASQLLYLAQRLVIQHRVHRSDLIEYVGLPLSAADARAVVAYAEVFPHGPFKAVILGLDGATERAQNILLKVLEEPPATIRFLLFAKTEPLPTVVSRARVYRFGGPGQDPPAGPDAARAKVSAALRAASDRDEDTLAAVLAGWDDDCQAVLASWAAEAASGRWERYGGLAPAWSHTSKKRAIAVLEGLARYPRARPANAAAVALGQAFRD